MSTDSGPRCRRRPELIRPPFLHLQVCCRLIDRFASAASIVRAQEQIYRGTGDRYIQPKRPQDFREATVPVVTTLYGMVKRNDCQRHNHNRQRKMRKQNGQVQRAHPSGMRKRGSAVQHRTRDVRDEKQHRDPGCNPHGTLVLLVLLPSNLHVPDDEQDGDDDIHQSVCSR